jgi:hypothetical protein
VTDVLLDFPREKNDEIIHQNIVSASNVIRNEHLLNISLEFLLIFISILG